MSDELWRWDAVELASAIRLRAPGRCGAGADWPGACRSGVQVIGGRYREDLCLDAAEVIETRCAPPTPIDPR
jgi:amidase